MVSTGLNSETIAVAFEAQAFVKAVSALAIPIARKRHLVAAGCTALLPGMFHHRAAYDCALMSRQNGHTLDYRGLRAPLCDIVQNYERIDACQLTLCFCYEDLVVRITAQRSKMRTRFFRSERIAMIQAGLS